MAARRIKGITVKLITRKAELDEHNYPTWTDVVEEVDNVLIGQPTTSEVENNQNVHHEILRYVLAIPKGDTHEWQDAEVEFWGKRFRQYGQITQGIEAMIPLDWNMKVMVEEVI